MRKKILLADDSITIQKVIELTFSDEDFDVVTVGNGRLAVERIEDIQPDIVLCDIIMPEKDGYEVCDYIKKHPRLSSIPVLLLTGAFEPFDQERAARAGCDGFLAKPFEPASLIGKVNELLARSSGQPTAHPASTPAFEAAPPAPAEMPRAPEPDIPEPLVEEETAPEPTVSFIPEEPIVAEEPIVEDLDSAVFPLAEDSIISQAMPAEEPSVLEQEFYGVGEEIESAPEDYVPVTPEEAHTLSTAPLGGDLNATLIYSTADAPWAQPPLEPPPTELLQEEVVAPADAEVAAFEEVFDEEVGRASIPREIETPPGLFSDASGYEEAPAAAEPPAAFAEPSAYGEPVMPLESTASLFSEMSAYEEPAAPSEAEEAPEPPPATFDESSFADILPPRVPEPAPAPSEAAEVPVPVDMVAQIAQRVVAQISERVVREVAWEIIPDLAEALIRKEIERLKAELQRT